MGEQGVRPPSCIVMLNWSDLTSLGQSSSEIMRGGESEGGARPPSCTGVLNWRDLGSPPASNQEQPGAPQGQPRELIRLRLENWLQKRLGLENWGPTLPECEPGALQSRLLLRILERNHQIRPGNSHPAEQKGLRFRVILSVAQARCTAQGCPPPLSFVVRRLPLQVSRAVPAAGEAALQFRV